MLLAGTAFAVLRIKFEGEDLGVNIASLLNKRMRGRIAIGSVEWPTSALKTVATGGWVPLTIRDVRVWDDCVLASSLGGVVDDRTVRLTDPNLDCTPDDHPDPDPKSLRKPRKLLVRAPLITAEVDVHALMFGNHNFVFRNVHVHGGEALIEQTREPYPLHAYDRTVVSIVTAFYPRMKAGFRAGIYADSPPPVFDVRDIHVHGLNLTVHMQPYAVTGGIGYAMTARIEGVDVDASETPTNDSFLYMDATDPLIAKFYVRLGVTAPRGTLQIMDEGPRTAFLLPFTGGPRTELYPPKARVAKYTVHLADLRLNRLAQLPNEWARHDFVANTLELDLSAKTVPCPTLDNATPSTMEAANLRFTGELDRYFDRPYDGKWDLRLDVDNMGPTIRSCVMAKVGGDDLNGTITLTGPFVAAPKITLDLKNVDFDVPLRAEEEPIRLTLAEVHGGIDLVNEQGYIEETKALVRGGKEPGEVNLSATFGLKPYNANAVIEIPKAIDVGRFLPPKIRTSVGRFLAGRLSAKGDVDEGFALEDFDLTLGERSTPLATDKLIRAHHGRLFTDNAFESIQIEQVDIEAGRSRARFDGSVDTRTNNVDITIDGNFPDLDVWLRRFGLPPLFSSANGGVIRVTGKITAPKINARTTLAGVPCIDTLRLDSVSVADGVIEVQRMSSPGLGGTLSGTARIRLGDVPYIERMHLSGSRLEAARLCGLNGVAKGTIEKVEVDLHGSIDKNRSAMDWLALASVDASAQHLNVKGDGYSKVAACLNRKEGKDDALCRPRGAGYLDVDDRTQCDAAKKGAGGFCLVAAATRDTGGTIDATIAKLPGVTSVRNPQPARLAGTVALGDVPLALVDQFLGKPGTLGGFASLTLNLAGSPTSPRASGIVELVRVIAKNAFIGDSQLAIAPVSLARGMPGLAIHGTALAGRVVIDGTIGTVAPFPVEVVMRGHGVEVDQFVDLTALANLGRPTQAWASGSLSIKTELAPLDGRPAIPEAWVELSDLRVQVLHRGTDGRVIPLLLTAASPDAIVVDDRDGDVVQDPMLPGRAAVSLRITPTTVEFACKDPKSPSGRTPCPSKFDARPLGAPTHAVLVAVRGQITPSLVALTVDGQLKLSQLTPLVEARFDQISGTARLQAAVVGTPSKPRYEAALELHDLLLRPVGGDTLLEAPTGLIKLANGSLGFANLEVNVRDERRDDSQGKLEIHGGIALDGFTPVSWGVFIEGKLAAKLLMVVAPSSVSQASGVATIGDDAIRLWGKGPRPLIAGSLTFDSAEPVAVLPRGVRRELSFSRGAIEIVTCAGNLPPEQQDQSCRDVAVSQTGALDQRVYRLGLSGIGGKIDNEGQLTSVDGSIQVRDGEVAAVSVTVDAESIPFRIPGTLDLVLSLKNIGLELAGGDWTATGAVSVVSGTYKTNFDLTDRITKIGLSTPPQIPFWETYPALGNATLDLTLDVRKFSVDNNIASIDLSGKDIQVTQTPRDPRLSGSILVQQGRFRIPGTRAAFTKTGGSVDFSENVRASNPRLEVTSDANYRDLSGQEHIITMTITGTLEQPQWDLKTSTGYNKSQTLSLLVLGRNQEQLRRSLGDQALGGNLTNVDPTTNPSQGFADQIVKDLAGDWVSGLIGTSLTTLTGLDVLRFDIGFGSVGVHLEKKVAENVRILGDAEQTIRGSTLNARAEMKLSVRLGLQGGILDKNFIDPAEQDIQDRNVKFVYRWFVW